MSAFGDIVGPTKLGSGCPIDRVPPRQAGTFTQFVAWDVDGEAPGIPIHEHAAGLFERRGVAEGPGRLVGVVVFEGAEYWANRRECR